MNLVVVLLAAPLLFLFAEEPRYHGETVAQPIEHTRTDNALREREKAIGSLGILAREQMGWFARGKDSEAKEQARAWVTREIVPTVAALLNDENPVIRRTAANTFRNLGTAGKQAIPALTNLLTDKDELVRRRAAEALEAMGQEAVGSVPALVKMAREDSRRGPEKRPRRHCCISARREARPFLRCWTTPIRTFAWRQSAPWNFKPGRRTSSGLSY